MSNSRFLGVGMIVIGFLMLAYAYQTAGPADASAGTFIGRYSDRTVWLILGGLVASILGVALAVFGKRAVN